MKFLVLTVLLAAASAEYHDDTFHFTSSVGSAGVGGLLGRNSFSLAPTLAKQYTTVQAVPVFAPFGVQPVHTPQYVHQVASPVIVKSVPVLSQRYYTAGATALPVLSQKLTTVKAFTQQTAVPKGHAAQPVASSHASAASSTAAPQWRVLSHVLEADPAGPYKLSYATENGIQASVQGSLIPGADGPESGVVAMQGSYSYTGPDGVVYTVNYIADEAGFRAAGDHLPTPPPVPAEILRSLPESASDGGKGERHDE